MKAGEDVKFDFKAVNERQTREDFTIKYQLYRWDTLKKENILKETSEKITLNPGETKDLSYVIPKIAQGTYQSRIAAESPMVESMIDIRLTTEQVQQGRINFATLDKFPLQKDQPAKFMACFQNGGGGIFNGTVELSLKDEKGNIVGQKDYTGPVNPNFSALVDDFTAKGNYDYLALTATIKGEDGKIMDQVTTEYGQRSNKVSAVQAGTSKKYLAILIAVLILVLAAVLVVYLRKRKKDDIIKFGIFFFLILSVALLIGFSGVKSAKAADCTTFNGYGIYAPLDGFATGVAATGDLICMGGGDCYCGTFANSSAFIVDHLTSYCADYDYDLYVNISNAWLALKPECLFKNAAGTCLTSPATINAGDKITAPLLYNGEWIKTGGHNDSPPYNKDYWETLSVPTMYCPITADVRGYVDGTPENTLSVPSGGGDPARVTINGNDVTANVGFPDRGQVTLKFDTRFHVVNEVSSPAADTKVKSDLTTQSTFVLNIDPPACTSNWQASATPAPVGTPSCQPGIPPLGTLPGLLCTNHLALWHDAGGCKTDCANTCNQKPSKPKVSVPPADGNISTSYNFTAYDSFDPDGDQIEYHFDWGDGSFSDWTSYVVSGAASPPVSHSYSSAGTYQIKAQANDGLANGLSDWSDAFPFRVGSGPPPACVTGKQVCQGDSITSCNKDIDCLNSTSCAITGSTTWTCSKGTETSSPCPAIVNLPDMGECGTVNGGSFCNIGDISDHPMLCKTGTPIPNSSSIDTSGYEVTWTCGGQNACPGGSKVSCSANGKKACGWVETNP